MGHCVTFKTPFTVFMSLAENCQTGNGGIALFNFLGKLNQPSFCLSFALWSIGIVMITNSVVCMHFLEAGNLWPALQLFFFCWFYFFVAKLKLQDHL